MEISECLNLIIKKKKQAIDLLERAYDLEFDNHLSTFILYIDKTGSLHVKEVSECDSNSFYNDEYIPLYITRYFDNEDDIKDTVELVFDKLSDTNQQKFKEACIAENAVTPQQQLHILLNNHENDYYAITHCYDSSIQFCQYQDNEYLTFYNEIIDNLKSCSSLTEYKNRFFPELSHILGELK